MSFPATSRPRRRLALLAAMGAVARPRALHALMAGAEPDSPEARVDRDPDSRWTGAVAVRAGGGTYSGALVRRRWVLTAAHVVAGRPPDEVAVQVNAGGASLRIGAEAIHVHPDWKGWTKPFAFGDLALVSLRAAAPYSARVYRPYLHPLVPGEVLVFVGYGASGHGDRGPEVGPDPSVRRLGLNRAERFVEAPDAPGRPSIFLYDFDGPDASTDAFGSLTLGNSEETSAAGGDSGAPAFVLHGGFPRIAGVLTFVADYARPGTRLATFGASGGGILLSAVAPWLEGVLGPD